MGGPAQRGATYEDVLRAPDHLVAELIDGELHTSPRPASLHAYAASIIGMDLGGPFQRGRGGPGGWWIVYEPELHLGDAVLVPDLAGWRRERMPEFPDVSFFTLAPDWVAEVLSDSTRQIDRVRKLPIYARHGVGHAWLVDPAARTLEVFRLHREAEGGEGQWLLAGTHSGDATLSVEPFEAVPFELGALWARPEG